MIVAIPAIAKVAAKILSMLLGDKKGRKFLGYVVGIVLFIVLIPIIAVYGLFGWMAGGGAEDIFAYEEVYQNLPTEIQEQISDNDTQLATIEAIFTTNGISEAETNKAKVLYLSFLTDYANEENFYQRYADCFLAQSEESDLLTNISSAFGVVFTDADKQQYNEYFGGS